MDDYEENTTKYPLSWPASRPRSTYREGSRFKTTFAIARRDLMDELNRLGAKNIILSTNVPLRKIDDMPRGDMKRVNDPGVAVYFRYCNRPMVFACDKYDRVEDNMRAITKTIDALRGIARWGTGDMMERAFTGFEALPAPVQWWRVMGFETLLDVTLNDVEERFRQLAMERHPDRNNGSDRGMGELNWARDRAYEHFRG